MEVTLTRLVLICLPITHQSISGPTIDETFERDGGDCRNTIKDLYNITELANEIVGPLDHDFLWNQEG